MKSTIKRWAEKIEFMTATYLEKKKIYKTLDYSRQTGEDLTSRKKFTEEHTVPGHLGSLANTKSAFHIYVDNTISSIIKDNCVIRISY